MTRFVRVFYALEYKTTLLVKININKYFKLVGIELQINLKRNLNGKYFPKITMF